MTVTLAGAAVREATASCNVIPSTTRTFAATQGSTSRPFAAPGETVELALRPCDATEFQPVAAAHVVTVVFKPASGGLRNVVALAADCTAVDVASCAALPEVESAVCREVTAGTDLATVVRNGSRRLSFRFPDTDADLAPDGDDRTFAGPAAIAVTAPGAPLPCGLATTSCASLGTAGLLACVDELFADDGACGTLAPHPTFPHFTALPPPNDFRADCFLENPPCTALATELRVALDASGNLLAPVSWQGVLVRSAAVPVPRLVRGRIRSPLPFRVPDQVFLGSFTPEGVRLPPIFEPQLDPTVTAPDVVTFFGSADAPYTVLRVARWHGTCAGGPDDGGRCAGAADCPGGACVQSCVDDKDIQCPATPCPSGPCGSLYDFGGFATLAGRGPLVLPRLLPGFCQLPPHDVCTPADCPGAGDLCVSYAFEAQNPVTIEGLVGTAEAFTFVAEEAIDQRPRNGDTDTVDSVVTLRDRLTGVGQPLGAPLGCGIPTAPPPEGRGIVRVRQPPFSFPAVAAESDAVAFLESEPAQNDCDENSDGDVVDAILRVFRLGPAGVPAELTAGLSPLRALDAAPRVRGRSVAVSAGRVFYRRPEAAGALHETAAIAPGDPGVSADFASLSADGRLLSFLTNAALLPEDANGITDVYVYERETGTLELASVPEGGAAAAGATPFPGMSPDGTVVAFLSLGPDLVAGDTNGVEDVFVRDRVALTTQIVSVSSAGVPGNGRAFHLAPPALSRDGRFVAFTSSATNLVPGDDNTFCPWTGSGFVYDNRPNCPDVLVRDRLLGTTERVSVATDGTQANAFSGSMQAISADGRYVAFYSDATNLTPGGAGVFLRDRCLSDGIPVPACTPTTERVDVAPGGGDPDGVSFAPIMSADGRFVAFVSLASNLVAGDTNGWADVFVHDRQSGTTIRASVASSGEQADCTSGFVLAFIIPVPSLAISPDGRFVAFSSCATNLVAGDDATPDVYVHDQLTGLTQRVSVTSNGSPANDASVLPTVSADGRYVAFQSIATNLDPGDTSSDLNVFLRQPDPADVSDPAINLFDDADLDDTVLEVLDTASGLPTTLCPAGDVAVAAGNAAFLRPEGETGTAGCPGGPLNLDADTDDLVVHLWRGGSVAENLRCAATAVSLSAPWVAALVDEAGQGDGPLNGDGDADDTVVKIRAAGDPAPANCGAWANVGQAADVVEVSGSLVAFVTPEGAQGAGSLNPPDADADDRVLQLFDAGAFPGLELIAVGQAAEEFVVGERGPTACGDRQLVAFRTPEAAQGNADLNGDGDSADGVLQVVDGVTATLKSTGQAVTPCRLEACDPRAPYRISGSQVRFLTLEAEQGSRDLNDNGVASDLVVQVFDFCTGVTTVVGTVDPAAGGAGDPLADEDASQVLHSPGGRCAPEPPVPCDPLSDPCGAGEFCGVSTSRCTLRVPGSCTRDADCPPGAVCVPDTVAIAAGTGDGDGDGVPDDMDTCAAVFDPTQADLDGDGVGDVCDAGATCRAAAKPKITVLKLDTPPGDDRLSMTGEVILPVPFTPPLDPLTNGVRVLIDDAVGNLLDLPIPGGALDKDVGVGWKVNRTVPPTKWAYVNNTASPPFGIRRVVVRDRSVKVPGLVKFVVKGKDRDYTALTGAPPLLGLMVVDPMAGICGALTFPGEPGPACAFSRTGRAFKCK